jgi:hypothetical protein
VVAVVVQLLPLVLLLDTVVAVELEVIENLQVQHQVVIQLAR